MRQPTIDVFFQKNGKLCDMENVCDIGDIPEDQISDQSSDLDVDDHDDGFE